MFIFNYFALMIGIFTVATLLVYLLTRTKRK